MSRWRLKSEAEQSQDEWKTFAQLAEMLADGTIDESDLVQSDFRSGWIPVDSVRGLLKSTLRISKSRSSQETNSESVRSSAADAEPPVHETPASFRSGDHSPRPCRWACRIRKADSSSLSPSDWIESRHRGCHRGSGVDSATFLDGVATISGATACGRKTFTVGSSVSGSCEFSGAVAARF